MAGLAPAKLYTVAFEVMQPYVYMHCQHAGRSVGKLIVDIPNLVWLLLLAHGHWLPNVYGAGGSHGIYIIP